MPCRKEVLQSCWVLSVIEDDQPSVGRQTSAERLKRRSRGVAGLHLRRQRKFEY
jgi:hypothetical protein